MNSFEMIFSRILKSVGRRLIGIYEKGASGGLPALSINIIIECFQMEGIYYI